MNSRHHSSSFNAPAEVVELPELGGAMQAGAVVLGASSTLLDSVSVVLSVMVGQTSTTLGELMKLKESSVLKLDRLVDSPVDLVVNGNLVARGQLVVVDDNFGVRVTEIALSSPT